MRLGADLRDISPRRGEFVLHSKCSSCFAAHCAIRAAIRGYDSTANNIQQYSTQRERVSEVIVVEKVQ